MQGQAQQAIGCEKVEFYKVVWYCIGRCFGVWCTPYKIKSKESK